MNKTMEIMEWIKGQHIISTDKTKIDLLRVHHFLSESYWAEGIPIELVKKSIDNSLCFGVYRNQKIIGFARVISDFTTFAYLADVFIISEERGIGLSKWLMSAILEHPQLQGLRLFTLATRDAHGLYAQFGFTSFDKPERWMQRHNPDVYKRKP
jgi:N-acetylglutamate synthase-like GNAT family acetyltransferase